MKKHFLKLVLIIGLISIPVFTDTAAAADNPTSPEEPVSLGEADTIGLGAEVLEKIKKDECIKEETDDSGYIITIIEEPLDVKTNEDNPDFKYRICYRHSVTVVDDETGLTETESALSKGSCLSGAALTRINAMNTADSIKASYHCSEVQVILSKGGTATIYGYIGMIYQWGAGLAGIIAVTVIIISGIQISAAGGDPEAVGNAKKRILRSLAGIIVLFLSGLILYTINPNFFVAN